MNAFEAITRLLPPGLRLPPAPSEQSQTLAEILRVTSAELTGIRMGGRYYYRPFTIKKPDGRERRILAPSPALKQLQRRLLDGHLARLPVHPCATAFRAGASIFHNARCHARQTWIATVDLRDFFETTRGGRIRSFFARQGWRDDALQTLMRLCVFRNGLPQGAPTSPCLSNLVNVTLDERLELLARRAGAFYTRYGDDLTFSWNIERVDGSFSNAVAECLHGAGYEIQSSKGWQVRHIGEKPCVTGLILAGKGRVQVPWNWRWRMWRARWQAWWSTDERAAARLQGWQAAFRMVVGKDT